MKHKDEDRVLIAGAGPAGLVAATVLAEAGIPVLVVEAQPALPRDLRASTFHPPTLDLLDRFAGVTAELISLGLIAPSWQLRDRATGPVVTWDMGLLAGETRHPYRVQVEQWRLTGILAHRLAKLPHAALRYSHEVVAASQDGDRATLRVKTPGGEEAFFGRYAIGCEGANSPMRRSMGIAYEGMTLPERYLTLSTRHDFARDLPGLTYVNYVSDPEEWLVLLRVADAWRVLFPTRPDESAEEAVSEAAAQRRLGAVVGRTEPFELTHRTLYNVHERVADKYRLGRLFLAGDAAHINNPLGGMGMNGGIQDAFNLADKIVAVWRQEASDDLLDRYERQRRWMALDFVQRNALRNRETLRERDPAARRARHDEMRRIAADPAKAKAFLLGSSMIAALRQAEAIP